MPGCEHDFRLDPKISTVQMVKYLVREARYVGEENVEDAAENHKTEGQPQRHNATFPFPDVRFCGSLFHHCVDETYSMTTSTEFARLRTLCWSCIVLKGLPAEYVGSDI